VTLRFCASAFRLREATRRTPDAIRWRLQRGEFGGLLSAAGGGSVKGFRISGSSGRCQPCQDWSEKAVRSMELTADAQPKAEEGGYVAFNPEPPASQAESPLMKHLPKTCARQTSLYLEVFSTRFGRGSPTGHDVQHFLAHFLNFRTFWFGRSFGHWTPWGSALSGRTESHVVSAR